MRNSWKRVGVATAVVALVAAAAGCGGSSAGGTDSGSGSSSTGGIARAETQVTKFAENPALTVSPLPSEPKTSTHAIQVNCTIPACAPGAMKPAMAALSWRFEEMPYDISKGPSAAQDALTRAIAAKPDVIFFGANYPEAIFKSQIEAGVKQGIKFVNIGGTVSPNYSACIQCTASLEALGALAADIALADAGGKTEIAVASDDSIAALKSEADGVKAQVAKNGEGSKVLDLEQSVSATPADNAARTVSFLQRNPNVKYLIATQQFVNAQALASAGLGSRVKLVGMYPLNETDAAVVKDGQVLAYATGELASLYWRAADAAVRAIEGAKMDPAPIQSLRVINKSNADASLLEPANYQDIYKKAWHRQ